MRFYEYYLGFVIFATIIIPYFTLNFIDVIHQYEYKNSKCNITSYTVINNNLHLELNNKRYFYINMKLHMNTDIYNYACQYYINNNISCYYDNKAKLYVILGNRIQYLEYNDYITTDVLEYAGQYYKNTTMECFKNNNNIYLNKSDIEKNISAISNIIYGLFIAFIYIPYCALICCYLDDIVCQKKCIHNQIIQILIIVITVLSILGFILSIFVKN